MLAKILSRIRRLLPFQKWIGGLWPNLRGRITFSPGHFYSPLLNIEDFQKSTAKHEADARMQWDLVGLSAESHRFTFAENAQLSHQFGFPKCERYTADNPYFYFADAFTASAMIAKYRPSSIIEVGCGFSSAAMLDAVASCGLATGFHFIDPFPDRLKSLISDAELQTHRLSETTIQNVGTDIFASLKPNDILFIDSSHVLKVGSDLLDIFVRILPAIAPGVIIHFHDVFYPIPYPADWIIAGRAWNEALLLQTLLRNSPDYEVLFFNSYFKEIGRPEIAKHAPRFSEGIPASIRLRKRVPSQAAA